MGYKIEVCANHGHPYLQIQDADPDAIRLLWYHSIQPSRAPDDPLARELAAEEALHVLFKRLFLLAPEQRLN